MRGDRPSLTAELVTAVRALTNGGAGDRRAAGDPIAEELLSPPFQLLLHALRKAPREAAFAVTDIASRGLARNVALRTLRIDDALLDAVHGGARQLVLLGAGLDARAWRLPELSEVTVFEVDHRSTQRVKRDKLAAKKPLARDVVFVEVDFEKQSLDAELTSAGFHPKEKSVWIWEGVTMYLTAAARRGSLRTIAACSAPGSTLVTTYIAPSSIAGWERQVGRLAALVVGESIRGVVDTHELHDELESVGLSVAEDSDGSEWAERYWGEHDDAHREWERIVIAEKKVT